ncbi:MAG: hypothetical protein KC635_03615, partial [Myxococcales bacterium]|nr:hypothetical protein [Myxococcales bacterium]
TDFFRVDVGLEVASCSVAATCPETVGTEAKPSLLTGVSCGFPGAWDGLLLFSRALVCVDGATSTPIGTPSTTTGERAYAAERVDTHTDYVNTTQYLDPLASHDSCTYDAEAFILAYDGAPAVYHRQNPARMTWHVEVDPALEGSAQCQFGGGSPPSGVGIDYPASLTVSKPVAVAGGVQVDYATVTAANVDATLDPSPVGGARVRYVVDATIPTPPMAVTTWAERDIWIAPFEYAYAVEVDSTCVHTNASGDLVSIGVLFRRSGYMGVVEVKSTNSTGARFDCERDPDDDFCTNVIAVSDPNGGEAVCAAALAGCYDGLLTGSETDVDCGGGCTPCDVGDACVVDSDCASGRCDALVCATSAFGDGRDGALTVSSGAFDPTQAVGGSLRAGATAADAYAVLVTDVKPNRVTTATALEGLGAGDLVLVLAAQNSTDTDGAGIFDLVHVAGVVGTTITTVESLYEGNYETADVVFAQRVPQYANVSISGAGVVTAAAYDPTVTPT